MSYTSFKMIDDDTQLLLPSIKNLKAEFKLSVVKNDILGNSAEDIVYFPFDFRLENIVIESIAKKYLINDIESWWGSDERFLIGIQSCNDAMKRLECPYLLKVENFLKGIKGVSRKDIVAIYLLDEDDSDENRQKFILLTKKAVYLRYDTNGINKYNYTEIVLKNYQIEDKFGNPVLAYEFDENFYNFFLEFQQLFTGTVNEIGERHPFADKLPEHKQAYIAFLVDAAAADGYLTVENLIRLEYLAREFNVSAEKMVQFLKDAFKGGIKANKLSEQLRKFLTIQNNDTENYYVFFQDVLELVHIEWPNRRILRPKLIQLLTTVGTAGTDFIENYSEYVKQRKQADYKLKVAMEHISKIEKCGCEKKEVSKFIGAVENALICKKYNDAMNLQILKLGVE